MPLLTFPLAQHHKHCDDLFADTEALAQSGDWPACGESFGGLRSELDVHFSTEERQLFPAFEAATGSVNGPTQMMRHEHAQMRDVLVQMADALQRRDGGAFGGACETLLILMQQHNMKEENILYPMCDRALQGQVLDIESSLRNPLGAA